MKTYILYQNGKLIMKEKQEKQERQKKQERQEKQEIKNKVPKTIPNFKQQPVEQKQRAFVAPPLIEPLKNTHISHQSGGKKIKASELQLDLFSKLCKIINIDSAKPIGNDIPFEKLQDDNVIKKLYDIQEKLKDVFPSSKLTALHTNALKKQSFPGVNIVRQIFKEMGYKLRPINTSEGYIGKKKILRRVYHIDKL